MKRQIIVIDHRARDIRLVTVGGQGVGIEFEAVGRCEIASGAGQGGAVGHGETGWAVGAEIHVKNIDRSGTNELDAADFPCRWAMGLGWVPFTLELDGDGVSHDSLAFGNPAMMTAIWDFKVSL